MLVAFELIHHMQRKGAREEGEIALKLDISKAYDMVDWRFLKERMRVMGFNQRWVSWIMMCVTTVTYEFCFNGTSVGPIQPTRGLRQEDPLSPYLFLLCVEGLSNSLSTAANEGPIHGARICNAAPTVTHLLFADDSFLFFCANHVETETIKNLLNAYEKVSGQSVNFQKSGIHFSSDVKQQIKTELSNILGVTNNLHDSKYLGLSSLVGRYKKKGVWFCKRQDMEESSRVAVEDNIPSWENYLNQERCSIYSILLHVMFFVTQIFMSRYGKDHEQVLVELKSYTKKKASTG